MKDVLSTKFQHSSIQGSIGKCEPSKSSQNLIRDKHYELKEPCLKEGVKSVWRTKNIFGNSLVQKKKENQLKKLQHINDCFVVMKKLSRSIICKESWKKFEKKSLHEKSPIDYTTNDDYSTPPLNKIFIDSGEIHNKIGKDPFEVEIGIDPFLGFADKIGPFSEFQEKTDSFLGFTNEEDSILGITEIDPSLEIIEVDPILRISEEVDPLLKIPEVEPLTSATNNLLSRSLDFDANEILETPENSQYEKYMNIHMKIQSEENTFGLSEETRIAENILKDLESNFIGTCIICRSSFTLTHLKFHVDLFHPDCLVYCSCGYKGHLYSALVHSSLKFHLPNEARPIILMHEEEERKGVIVLERRPNVKLKHFNCFMCQKSFDNEKKRRLHFNMCKLPKNLPCEICGKKFAWKRHLENHTKWKHTFHLACKYCGRYFTSEQAYKQHLFHVHEKAKFVSLPAVLTESVSLPVVLTESDLYTSSSSSDSDVEDISSLHHCNKCDDTFRTSIQLKVHSRVHTGLHLHPCPRCSQKCISQNVLRKHVIASHAGLSRERKCSKKYTSDSSDSE